MSVTAFGLDHVERRLKLGGRILLALELANPSESHADKGNDALAAALANYIADTYRDDDAGLAAIASIITDPSVRP
jgi:hypothetical protein